MKHALKRDLAFTAQKTLWLSTNASSHLQLLQTDFEQAAFEGTQNNLQFSTSPSQTFFTWIPATSLAAEVGDFMIDEWAQKLRNNRYVLQNSDVRTQFFPGLGNLEMRRHYLKPLFRLKPQMEDKTHYGNIFLEVSNDGPTPFFIKVTANYYPGEEALRFEALVKLLLHA